MFLVLQLEITFCIFENTFFWQWTENKFSTGACDPFMVSFIKPNVIT